MKKCGYQFLPQSFFEASKPFGLSPLQKLLFLYLRGLCSRFQSTVFYWKDKQVEADIGINHKALQRARQALREKRLITYMSCKGKNNTVYKILPTVLLPRGVDKNTIRSGHFWIEGVDAALTSIPKSKQRLNNIIARDQIFKGINEQERKELKKKGIL